MVRYQTSVKLYDTDAAGLLFFGHQFRLAHDAYERYMEESGLSFASILAEGAILIPIVHAEADFTAAVAVGDQLETELTASKVSTHSFVLEYKLTRASETVGTAQTVHVTIDRVSGQKTPLPDKLRSAMEKLLSV